GGSRY
ncbi:EPSP synthase family protein, partial [Vibrio parahaemolyticus V-223/04]